MQHILHPTRVYQRTPVFVTITGSILLILLFASVIFAGTRNWEPKRPILATLSDISDLHAYRAAWKDSQREIPQVTPPSSIHAKNAVEQEVLGKGTIRPAFHADSSGLARGEAR